MCCRVAFGFFVFVFLWAYGAFVLGLSQISSFFHYVNTNFSNTDQVQLLSRLTCFRTSYILFLKLSFPDISLPYFDILA